ncbi:hypothetical protein [Roseateles sp.]|uniref:transposase n=1 Tax=Roseateles sp. TaxID=1971397 RepID=UPI0025CF0467|nr:hypothetical protein [Roseateles sp.]MBV8036216.1 hypothetical protein [Roseateles sp.]
MSHFFWKTSDWFSRSLCCRYLVVRFGKLSLPTLKDGFVEAAVWHWAIGFFRDGQFEVLGAWRDEGEGTALRIATNLHDRGIERLNAAAAEDGLLGAIRGLHPKVCRNTTAELVASDILGPRMRRAVRWTEVAGQRLQSRMSGAAKRAGPFADEAAAADFIAKAFQRLNRDLLEDRWERLDRKRSALFGQDAFAAYRAGAA